jgi:RNA-directed DNA polymerase
MMHEPEKSDSVVVAVKPTNKAERSVAELVEPRAETKGNADQQSTRRAQDRESVSQALERVGLAARRGKQKRFTSLLHHINPEMLRAAFYAMKRDAAPGVDGMTWGTYEQGLDRSYRGSARQGPNWSVPGAAVPTELHSERRR